MELWSGKDYVNSEAELTKLSDGNCNFTIQNELVGYGMSFTMDRKHLKDLFEAIGNEIGYWDNEVDRNEVVLRIDKELKEKTDELFQDRVFGSGKGEPEGFITKKTFLNIDRNALVANPPGDIMEWIRAEVRRSHGELAQIRELWMDDEWSLPGGGHSKVNITVAHPKDHGMIPEEWRASYANYLAQAETLAVTEILFDADLIDPDNLEWALAETKRVFGNRVVVEVFRSRDGNPPPTPATGL